jgi:hypothetical protein
MTGPENCVPLEEWRQRLDVHPLTLELAITMGTLSPVMHEGRRWVHYRGAMTWLASLPACPLEFAGLGAAMAGTPLVPRAPAADEGQES